MNRLEPATDLGDCSQLADLLAGLRTVVLSGAGCSTESGIPDYRGPETRRRARNPIRYQDFVGTDEMRARYWARSMVGWPRMRSAKPNDGHRAIATMEAEGHVVGTITQNVDGLHSAAGSCNVVELHGALREVVCLSCGAREQRERLQSRLIQQNSGFDVERVTFAPDGDADIEDVDYARFQVPECTGCGDIRLKPNVVFFGESVPSSVVDDAFALMEDAEALLVVGSSLTVYSGLRFVRFADKRRIPVAIVNLGETRGDRYAWLRVDGKCGDILPDLAQRLSHG